MRYFRPLVVMAMLVSMFVCTPSGRVWACPFCAATAQTFSEEFAAMKVVVIAKLSALPAEETTKGDDPPKAKFQIVTVMKGDELVKVSQTVETLYFGERKLGAEFLIMKCDRETLTGFRL